MEQERLAPFTIQAAGRFLEAAHAGKLLSFNQRADFDHVSKWILDVKHVVGKRFRKDNTHAYATYEDQTVTYNPLAMQWQSDEELFETVLHELGHLFIGKFVSPRVGHGYAWQMLGFVVGYAPVGCTSGRRRGQYLAHVERHRASTQSKGRFG